jgi:hypothetical protein
MIVDTNFLALQLTTFSVFSIFTGVTAISLTGIIQRIIPVWEFGEEINAQNTRHPTHTHTHAHPHTHTHTKLLLLNHVGTVFDLLVRVPLGLLPGGSGAVYSLPGPLSAVHSFCDQEGRWFE